MNKHRIGALVAAAAMTLTVAGTSLAVSYATVTGHTAFSSDANAASFWGADCAKPEWNGEDETYVLDQDYGLVVVKAGSGEFANTEFANASAGQTVWADVNGNGVYDDADKGISHIIFCDADETTTTSSEETDDVRGDDDVRRDDDDVRRDDHVRRDHDHDVRDHDVRDHDHGHHHHRGRGVQRRARRVPSR